MVDRAVSRQRPSRARLRRRVVTVLVVWCVGLALCATPAGAGVPADTAVNAPLVCDGQSVSGYAWVESFDSDDNHNVRHDNAQYIRVLVPPGGTISAIDAHGTMPAGGAGLHAVYANLLNNDGTPTNKVLGKWVGKLWYGNSSGVWQDSDPTNSDTWTPSGGDGVGSWQNESGATVAMMVKVWAAVGIAHDWAFVKFNMTVRVQASGGAAAFCSIFANEALNDTLGPAVTSATVADPVNTATGNLYDHRDDLDGPPNLYGVSWSRAYNSMDGYSEGYDYSSQPRVLGPKFVTPLDVHLKPLDTTTSGASNPGQTKGLEYLTAEGRRVVFAPTTVGSPGWNVPANLFASVSWNATTHQFTMSFFGGEVYTFNDVGRLVSKTSPTGQVASLCPATGFVTSLRTGASCSGTPAYELTFADNDSDGRVDRVTRPDGVFVDYQYLAGQLRLVSYPRSSSEPTGAAVQAEAGTGTAGLANGAALSSQFNGPTQMTYDQHGNMFVADTANHVVRKVTASGVVSTIAGTGTAGGPFPALSSSLSEPYQALPDGNGNIYVVDTENSRIRKIDSAGRIATVAGTGSAGFSGDGGAATSALLNEPRGITLDTDSGTTYLYIADTYNFVIRKVNLSTGIITTVAGAGNIVEVPGLGDGGPATSARVALPFGVAVTAAHDLLIADTYGNRIRKVDHSTGTITTIAGGTDCTGTSFCGDGGPATSAELYRPIEVTVDSSGKVTFSDHGNQRIRQIDASGNISTVAGGATCSSGNYCGDGGPATSAGLSGPYGIAFDSAGDLLISDTSNQRIRKVDHTTGVISLVAGDGYAGFIDNVTATSGRMNNPAKVNVDSAGNVYVGDTANHMIRKITASTNGISTIAGTGTNNDLATVPATELALNSPSAVAVDARGYVYIADTGNHRVLVVNPAGTIYKVAGTDASGYSGEGAVAWASPLNTPTGIAVNSAGDIYVADSGNHRIRKFKIGEAIASIAGTGTGGFNGDGAPSATQLNSPSSVVVDSTGKLIVADTANNRVRRVDTAANTVTTIAGGGTSGLGDGAAATSATLNTPTAVAVNAAGVVAVADTGNHRIRTFSIGGNITTALGSGAAGNTGDNTDPTGSTAKLNTPAGVLIEDSGAVHVADTNNHRIRYAATEAGYRYFYTGDKVRGVTRVEHTVGIDAGGTARPPMTDVVTAYNNGVPPTDASYMREPGSVASQDMANGQHIAFAYGTLVAGSPDSQTTQVTWCSKWTGTTCDTSSPSGGTTETTLYKHGIDGRLLAMTDTKGRTTAQGYDRDRNQAFTDRTGSQSGAAYDAQGRLIQQARPDPASGRIPQMGASGDQCHRFADGFYPAPGTSTTHESVTVDCAVDPADSTTNWRALFSLDTYGYCTAGNGLDENLNAQPPDPRVTTVTDAVGNVTRYMYNGTSAHPCLNGGTFQSYAAYSTPTAIIDANANTTTFQTEGAGTLDTGLVTQRTDPAVTTYTNWDVTRRLKISEGVGASRSTAIYTYFGYDLLGRRVVTRNPLGVETWTVYDASGRATDTVGPVAGPSRPCAYATDCEFPTSIPPTSVIDGPTRHASYLLDGKTKNTQLRPNRAETNAAKIRQTDYTTYYTSGNDTAGNPILCTPPAAGCEKETTVTDPPHGTGPGAPPSTTRTKRTTHFNAAGQAVWSKTSDTENVTTAVTSYTNFQTNATDPSTNLGLGRVANTVDPTGIKTSVGYDDNVDASGNGSPSGNGRVTSSGIGSTPVMITTKTYDARGRVKEERGVSGITDETGANAQTCTHYTYDVVDRVIQTDRGAAGTGVFGAGCTTVGSTKLLATRHVYDPAGRQTHTVVDADGDGTFTDVSCPSGGTVSAGDLITQSVYDSAGRLYQTVEQPVDLLWAADNATNSAHSGWTGFNWCTGTGKRTTTRAYDPTTGRLSTVTPADTSLAATAYSYDAAGQVIETRMTHVNTDSTTRTSYTKYGHDVAGRTVTTSVPSPALDGTDVTAVTCFNVFGDRTYQSDYHALTSGALTAPCTNTTTATLTDSAAATAVGQDASTYGQYQSFDYWADGSLMTAYSALRNSLGSDKDLSATNYFYDGRGNRTKRISWTCASTAACDTSHTRDGSHWHQLTETWAYNANNQIISYIDPAANETTYTYYGNADTGTIGTGSGYKIPGKLATITQPSGRKVTAGYRQDGQLAIQTFEDHPTTPDASKTVTLTFAYDGYGRVTKMTDQTGSVQPCYANPCATTSSYDSLGNLLSQTVPNRTTAGAQNWTTTYTRDLQGTIRELKYSDLIRFRFTHDKMGRATATSVNVAPIGQPPTWLPMANYGYTPFGLLANEGVLGGVTGETRAYVYGNTTGQQDTRPHIYSENLADLAGYGGNITTSLGYRPDRRLASEQTNSGTTLTYSYDDAGQLTGRTGGTTYAYTYNPRGLRLSDTIGSTTTSYTHNDNAQMQTAVTGASTTNYSWDTDGRRTCAGTTCTGTNTDSVRTTYDTRGLPTKTEATTTTSGSTTTATETRAYDAAARLARVTHDTSPTLDYDLLWDAGGVNPIPQALETRKAESGTSTIWQRSYWGKNRIGYNTTNANSWATYAYDAHGSVIQTSKIVAPLSYDPYGNPTYGTGVNPNRINYSYRGELTINGVLHLRARDYDARTGTFTKRDPLDGIDGTATVSNAYHYTDNDPLNRSDPSGMRPGPSTDSDAAPPPPPAPASRVCGIDRSAELGWNYMLAIRYMFYKFEFMSPDPNGFAALVHNARRFKDWSGTNQPFDLKPLLKTYLTPPSGPFGGKELVDLGDPEYLYYQDVLGNAMWAPIAREFIPDIGELINFLQSTFGGSQNDAGDEEMVRAGLAAGNAHRLYVPTENNYTHDTPNMLTASHITAEIVSRRQFLIDHADGPLDERHMLRNKLVRRSDVCG